MTNPTTCANLSADERAALIEELRKAMNEAAKDLDLKRPLACDRLHELERQRLSNGQGRSP